MAVFVDKLLIALGIDPRGAEQGLIVSIIAWIEPTRGLTG